MKKSHRTHAADARQRIEVAREKATRAFLGEEPAERDEGEVIDLADDAEEAMPLTATMRGLRAAEEA